MNPQAPPCTHREVTPIRECRSCGCFLRSYGNQSYCDPCATPEAELDEAEVFKRIARIPSIRQRQKAFEAYADMQDRVMA